MKRSACILLILSLASCVAPRTEEPEEVVVAPPVYLDLAKDDPNTDCPVHGIPLEISIVPIIYNKKPSDQPHYLLIESEAFPYARKPVLTTSKSGKEEMARIKTCFKCNSAYRIWQKTEETHQKKDVESITP